MGFQLCPPGIKISEFVPLLLMLLCEGLTAASVNSYISYMVMDLGVAKDIDDAGNYTGLLTAVFFICQFFASFIFSFLSDRYGRKTLIIAGSCFLFVFQILFGFSSNFTLAMVWRALAGIVNGNVGLVKTCIGEISNNENRVKAFTFVGLMFGLGSIFGSMMAGVTARPAVANPELFPEGSLFEVYPYLMPNLVIAACIFIAVVSGFFFIRETNADVVKKRHEKLVAKRAAGKEVEEKPEEIELEIVEAEAKRPEKDDGKMVWDMGPDDKGDESGLTTGEKLKRKWHRNKYIALAILNYVVCSAAGMILMVLMSVWTVGTIPAGGLGFTPSEVGVVNALGGVGTILAVLFVTDPFVKKFGVVNSGKIAFMVVIVLTLVFPLFNNLIKTSCPMWLFWILLALLLIVINIFNQIAFNDSIVMITNSAPPRKLAFANGSSQAFGSISRALSPVTISPLLAWSLEPGRKFPCDKFITFIVCAAIYLIAFGLQFLFPKSIGMAYGLYDKQQAELAAKAKDEGEAAKNDNQ